MSHLFDLTGKSFAALRLPATLAAVALLVGPALAWQLRTKRRHFESTVSVAFTSAIFLIAAHIAFVRFQPMLSSKTMADTVERIANTTAAAGEGKITLMLYGDQANGNSIIFYTQLPALMINGRTNALLWGSCYPDAPHIFLTNQEMLAMWGTGPRKVLFVSEEQRAKVASLLGPRAYLVQELSGKALYTDRPWRGAVENVGLLEQNQHRGTGPTM